MTAKLRSGMRAGDTRGFDLAHRLVDEAGVAAIAFHARPAAIQHKGTPDYELVAELSRSLPAPVILTGGLNDADEVRAAFQRTGVTAVMLARGVLGNPWLFRELLSGEQHRPSPEEVRASSSGRWRAPASTSGPSGAPATRASSTPGSWSASGSPRGPPGPSRRSSSGPPRWSSAPSAAERRGA